MVEHLSPASEIIISQLPFHCRMKESPPLLLKRIEYLGVLLILAVITEVAASTLVLVKSNRMILDEDSIDEKIYGQGIAVGVMSNRNLKSHSRLDTKVGNESPE